MFRIVKNFCLVCGAHFQLAVSEDGKKWRTIGNSFRTKLEGIREMFNLVTSGQLGTCFELRSLLLAITESTQIPANDREFFDKMNRIRKVALTGLVLGISLTKDAISRFRKNPHGTPDSDARTFTLRVTPRGIDHLLVLYRDGIKVADAPVINRTQVATCITRWQDLHGIPADIAVDMIARAASHIGENDTRRTTPPATPAFSLRVDTLEEGYLLRLYRDGIELTSGAVKNRAEAERSVFNWTVTYGIPEVTAAIMVEHVSRRIPANGTARPENSAPATPPRYSPLYDLIVERVDGKDHLNLTCNGTVIAEATVESKRQAKAAVEGWIKGYKIPRDQAVDLLSKVKNGVRAAGSHSDQPAGC